MSAGINYYPGRRRRPTLQTYSIQHSPDGIGSLFEYSRTLVQKKTSYDEEEEEPASGPEVQPFSFACELAHGSRQVRVSGFTSIPDLYKRIAELFKIEERNIMYCTLDTGNVDMDKLLSNQLAFNHTIYVHVRGQTKEVRFTKKAEKLGITLADNKAGGVFIKRITPGGVMDEVVQTRAHSIAPGDMIECINGRAFSQCRHLDVMHYLKALPVGSDIVLRLISPEKSLLLQHTCSAVCCVEKKRKKKKKEEEEEEEEEKATTNST
nr:unnamed protein product [Spirometra erinaceieuropaei]